MRRRKSGVQRSQNGCLNCRRRKVKCDESRNDRGQCGTCARLKCDCEWRIPLKFIITNESIARRYHTIESTPDSSRSSTPPETESPYLETSRTQSPDENRLGHKKPLLFVNIFSKSISISTYNKRRVLLTKDGYRPIYEEIYTSEKHDPDSPPIMRLPCIQSDLMDYGTRPCDNMKHPLLFDQVVCRKIMPMAVKFSLHVEDGKNVMVSLASDFEPLRHAICALTLLSSGLRDRPELVAGSFQHYDRAISACRAMSSSNQTEAVFLMHYLLLIYDIACASQRWPGDRNCWVLHLKALARFAHQHEGSIITRLRAYLSWYILLLDSQAGLAGHQDSGHYTRAFLESGRSLPLWPTGSTHTKTFSCDESLQMFMQVHKLSLHTLEMFAEQSQLALTLRNTSQEPMDSQNKRRLVQELSDQHANAWRSGCPPNIISFWGDESKHAADRQIISSTYHFARLQYSAISLHLHTSMYPRQRLGDDTYADEDAEHCRYIIASTRKSFFNNDRENHHLAHALFLAGIATRDVEEKEEILGFLEGMEQAGLSGAVGRVRALLQLVIYMQAEKEAQGGDADEVDWVDVLHQLSFKTVVFGM